MTQMFLRTLGFLMMLQMVPVGGQDVVQAEPQVPQSLSIMAYNLENLFDTEDDPKTNDQAYLPLAVKQSKASHAGSCPRRGAYREQCLELDWSESVVQAKMANLAKVILSANDGTGPDILLLSEVENLAVLKRLNQDYLKLAGYHTVAHLDSPDPRGIDTAVLSRLPLAGEPILHQVALPGKGKKKTRGILEVRLQIAKDEALTVFALHFPSPRNPHEQRVAAFKQLNQLAEAAAARSVAVVAGGDFNVTHRYSAEIYRGMASADWQVSHLIGCHQCLGTHNYKDSWSFLDALLNYRYRSQPSSKPTQGRWSFDPLAIRVLTDPSLGHVDKRGWPRSFDTKDRLGASDHFPVYAELVRGAAATQQADQRIKTTKEVSAGVSSQ